MIGDVVYVNGTFVKKEEATVSVFDHGFVYGDGAFEGLQAVAGGIFKLDAHIDRLYRSAHYLGFEIPLSPEAFIAARAGVFFQPVFPSIPIELFSPGMLKTTRDLSGYLRYRSVVPLTFWPLADSSTVPFRTRLFMLSSAGLPPRART